MSPSAPRSSPLALTVLSLLHYQPLHPYGMQRLIKEWGKDQVVNVSQRTSIHRTIERLVAAGLVEVHEVERDQQYAERTVYRITDEGRRVARAWLLDMLGTPRPEYPQFPVALSFALMLTPEETLTVLDDRAAAVARTLDALDAQLAGEDDGGPSRVIWLETEYQRTMAAAELRWLTAVTDDLRSGRLAWSWEELAALAGPGGG
ncbi:PadR family transcriptional regulator [Streptomyces griseofuscus]|uniref:PadR family transcriptional regulator n=1 Tax=Streptomyces griseofuscus TaxID=146922 RepID=A0A426SCZ7_9ACTN|nr:MULTISPECIES: PadR family transcriptional regulator [Streptomyces]MBJ6999531.1 PadR family transcriptional regulator [Streptomyces sp. CRPSP2-6A1]MYQ91940.1 PadR family transcriptional regulator [Streptomyces sp. SID4946]MYR89853.1 PadR family transcriptional regulator [Streptomyces sp. SID685]RRQ88623.1 PadR family transcriptional regulator [Streptomyces griseofuscus]SCF71036.1 Transcriptional regulator PadR-like family protein [Streptomyces sp. DconLS]